MSRNNKFLRFMVRKGGETLDTFRMWLNAAGLLRYFEQFNTRPQLPAKERIEDQVNKYSYLTSHAGSQLMRKVTSIAQNQTAGSNALSPQAYLTKICVLCLKLKKELELPYIQEVEELIEGFNTQQQLSLRFLRAFEEIISQQLKQPEKLQPSITSAAQKLLMKVLNQKHEVFEKSCNSNGMIETTKRMLSELDKIQHPTEEDRASYAKWTVEYANYYEEAEGDKASALRSYQTLMQKPFFQEFPREVQFDVLISIVRLQSDINNFNELPEEKYMQKESLSKTD